MSAVSRVGLNTEQPVQGVQSDPVFDLRSLTDANWDDIRVFLNVASERSLRAAATKSGVSVNTIRTRIARLEGLIGGPLVMRGYDGIKLTPSGIQLNKAALGMRGAAQIDGGGYSSFLKKPDELRIGASEGLGSGWLTPRLLELQEQYPALTMTMICDNDLVADHSDDLDIEITWSPPKNPTLIGAKLATLHFMPFASRDYVKINGMPRTWEDLLEHRLIEQVSPGIKSDMLSNFVGTDRPPGFVPIRTNSSLAIFWAVANGAGIAFMPTYASVLVDKLVPIDLPLKLKFDLFYYFHAEARPCGVVRAGVDWLKDCFDPVKYPWFRSEFIHPREFFPKSGDGSNVVPLFQTLVSTPGI
jgi:DNA-binding transcriptional LysR family regulator